MSSHVFVSKLHVNTLFGNFPTHRVKNIMNKNSSNENVILKKIHSVKKYI